MSKRSSLRCPQPESGDWPVPPVAGLVVALALFALPAFAQGDLEVGWISLEPQLAPPNNLQAPAEEGWPLEGDRVHWVAHLLNRGVETLARVAYAWSIDDGTSAAGEVDLPPGETTVVLTWPWTIERHVVSFRVEPPPTAGDDDREDDALSVVSNALSLGLAVEQDICDWLLENGGPGFERLMQREIAHWNSILARAVHPTTPQGALDRIRLDAVHVHPDGTGGRHDEFSTDLRWYFGTEETDRRFLHRGMDRRYRNDQTIILHELLHGRGLTDLYAYAVFHGDAGRTDSRVDIAENGRLVAGTKLMPSLNPASSVVTVYSLPANGLMGSHYRKGANLTEHSAFGLNLRAGRRTPQWFDQWGNRISLGNAVDRDSYLTLIPERTDVRLLDQDGSGIADASVEVYLDHSRHTYQNLYPAVPDRVFAADSAATFALPGDLLDGLPSLNDSPQKSLVVILGVKTPRARGYAFVPVYDLNLLYFRGQREHATMDLTVQLHPW